SFLKVNFTVKGFALTTVGFAVQSFGTRAADALRIWQPYQMLFSTRLVAYRLFPTQGPCRFGGSWSWMNTTVPAVAFCGEAVAPGPMMRLATSTSAPSSQTERLRMYP